MNGNISIVIGSWGSYNECNERALGSKWLDLSDYSDWDEIVEELKKKALSLTASTKNSLYKTQKASTTIPQIGITSTQKRFSTLLTNRVFLPTITNTKCFVLSSKYVVSTTLKNELNLTANAGTTISIFGVVSIGKITVKKCSIVADTKSRTK